MKKILASLVLTLAITSGAIAHSKVDKYSPFDGEILVEAPTAITMTFANPTRVTKVGVSHT
ncbi:MAG: hypothetical protein AB8B49_08825 [Nitratireductor sp.]